MKTLTYSIKINAPKEAAWKHMLDPSDYRRWTHAFSLNSQFIGEWKQGGTKAVLNEVTPHERLRARHVAIINKDGSEDISSEVAQRWVGVEKWIEPHFIRSGRLLLVRAAPAGSLGIRQIEQPVRK